MRIFVAGGTGVLGRRIVPLLVHQGHDVTVMARTPQRAATLLPPGARIVAGDALDGDAVAAAVTDARPEVVMHQLTDLAGGTGAANARLRVEGTRNLVDAAIVAGVERFVTQSIAWCYEPGSTPADETVALDTDSTDPGRRTTVDAVISMETDTARIPNWVVLRNGMLCGPDTWYAPDGLYGKAPRAGSLAASADITSFVHVDDAATAGVLAIGWPTGAVNVVDDEPAPGTTWVPAFCAAVDASPPNLGSTEHHRWARGATNHRARTLGWTSRHRSWRTGFLAAV